MGQHFQKKQKTPNPMRSPFMGMKQSQAIWGCAAASVWYGCRLGRLKFATSWKRAMHKPSQLKCVKLSIKFWQASCCVGAVLEMFAFPFLHVGAWVGLYHLLQYRLHVFLLTGSYMFIFLTHTFSNKCSHHPRCPFQVRSPRPRGLGLLLILTIPSRW